MQMQIPQLQIFILYKCECRVMPKDLGITRIRGLHKVVVKCGTCILIMPLGSRVLLNQKKLSKF